MIDSMTDDQLLDYITELERERSRVDAQQARAMARFVRLRDPRYAADEIAAALDWAPRTASNVVHTAAELVARLPETVDAVERGQLDMVKAKAILDWTEPLSVEQAREVAAGVHEWSVGRPVGALRAKLSRDVIKIDPETAEARRQDKLRQRKVSFFTGSDGMATLEITDSAPRIRAMYKLVDRVARKLKAEGDTRTLDQLRTDAFFDLLAGCAQTQVSVELHVTVPASVLAGVGNAPGWLHGYGPITSAAVRELAEQSHFWRRLITDPATGTVIEVSGRHPAASLRNYLAARTAMCTAPGCRVPAESCELDHLTDYSRGGPTAEANLGPACRHHNLMKLHGGWKVTQPQPGWYRWISPTGRTYDRSPEPLADNEPPR